MSFVQYHVNATFYKKRYICSYCATAINYSSFPAIHKFGKVDIFALHKFENKLDTVTVYQWHKI